MKLWIFVFITSLILTLAMGFIFFLFILLANGLLSTMPTYLVLNCLVWLIMVGVTTATSWLIFTIAKQQQPFWQIGLLNVAIATICLAIIAYWLKF